MQINKLIVISLLTFSCASNKQGQSARDRIENKELSEQSVLDLSRTSFQRGCIEGLKYQQPLKTFGSNFKVCLDMAKKHESDIREILK